MNTSRALALKSRAEMLSSARDFFAQRSVLEIDVPALIKHPPIDSNIDCIEANGLGFLHTSPEYTLKRLLSLGAPDCYFLGHVYRKEELGRFHNPEFTMVEWYRIGFSYAQMIRETAEFLFLFFGQIPIEEITYKQAFETYLGIDPETVSLKTLQELTKSSWDKQTCIYDCLASKIEPHLGQNGLTALTHYPPHEAALAKTTTNNGEKTALRFEIYYKGVELANGYEELSDANELRCRFESINTQRAKEGKDPYPLDEKFLTSLTDLPPCSGVALGFDRALMIQQKKSQIKEILPFSWDNL